MTDTTTPPTVQPKKNGRPRKADPPRVAYHELDRLLVFGELFDDGDGHGPATRFPSYRDLAKRYGVNHSVIANYSARHECLRRREAAKQRVDARTDEKLVEQRATELATGKARALEAIDTYITSFGVALEDGRVRVDSVNDFNLMLRLKEFLEGGPDARHEVNGALSLSELQRPHQRMLRDLTDGAVDPSLGGMLPARRSASEQEQYANPPTPSTDETVQKPDGHFEVDDDERWPLLAESGHVDASSGRAPPGKSPAWVGAFRSAAGRFPGARWHGIGGGGGAVEIS